VDKASFFILNVFINSFLAFFTVIFLVEMVIFLFRVRQGRLAAILRMIPILKLPLDLCLYDFSSWAYTQGINPLNCEEGTRSISLMLGWMSSIGDWFFLPLTSGIQLTVPGNLTFTVADVVGHVIKPHFLKIFAIGFVFVSIVCVIKKVIRCRRSLRELRSLVNSSQPANRKVRNSTLTSYFKKYRSQVVTSSVLTGSPFVAGLTTPIVYLPTTLSTDLSRKEYEAVLAHEIEHIRHKDSWVRLILDCIGSIFWWVPTRWLHRRIEEGQEIGCDLKCARYGVNPLDLASAMCKSAKYAINTPDQILVHHLTKHTVHKRMNFLLQPVSIRFRKIRFILSFLAAGIAFSVILVGRFWIF
jgi:beta-lactamase regulating signal transducer with metallopeptidase domain